MPSGDIFRELHVRAENDCGVDREILMRRFAEASAAEGWVLRDAFDDRVIPGETRRVVLHLPRCDGTTRYEVSELRLGEEAAERRRIATNDYVIPLARGIVDPPRSLP